MKDLMKGRLNATEKGRLKRCIINRGNASMAVSTVVGTAKKMMQFGIFVCVEIQEINFRGNILGSKCDGDYHHNITSLVNNMQLY